MAHAPSLLRALGGRNRLFIGLFAICQLEPATGVVLFPGDIVVAGQGGAVTRADPATGALTEIYQGDFLPRAGIALDADQQILLVTDTNNPSLPDYAVVRLDPETSHIEVVSSGGLLPSGTFDIAVAPSGSIFAGNIGRGVVEIDASTGEQRLISNISAFGIAFHDRGDLWVGGFAEIPESVVRLDPDTGVELDRYPVPLCALSGGRAFRLLTVDDDFLFVNCSRGAVGGGSEEAEESAILRIDVFTGVTTTLSSGGLLIDPYGIAVAPDGSIFVADAARVIEVNPLSGEQALLAAVGGGATGITIVRAACNDRFDNDGDGLADYPDDPDCPDVNGASELLAIDIKPGTNPASINLRSHGVVPVAILGSPTFDVTRVDSSTLAFGPNSARPAHRALGKLKDVNGDLFPDLISQYRTAQTGIAPGDRQACLTGSTSDGVPFRACDSIRTVPTRLDLPNREAGTPACGLGFEITLALLPLVWARRRREQSRQPLQH